MEVEASSGGIGFFGLLQIALIVLKIMGYIQASWFIVLLPSFISLFLCLVVVCLSVALSWKYSR